jgi:hypothetical protein
MGPSSPKHCGCTASSRPRPPDQPRGGAGRAGRAHRRLCEPVVGRCPGRQPLVARSPACRRGADRSDDLQPARDEDVTACVRAGRPARPEQRRLWRRRGDRPALVAAAQRETSASNGTVFGRGNAVIVGNSPSDVQTGIAGGAAVPGVVSGKAESGRPAARGCRHGAGRPAGQQRGGRRRPGRGDPLSAGALPTYLMEKEES